MKKHQRITGVKFPQIMINMIVIFILIVVFKIVYDKVYDQKLDLNGDNFSYLLLSKNILDGQGYSNTTPDGTYKPHGHFPPGYPYILATAQFFIGDNVNGLKTLNGLLLLLSSILFFFIAKKFSGNYIFAFSISVLLLLNSGLLRSSTIIMSEIPYLFFVFLALYSLLKIDEQDEKIPFWKSRWFYLTVVSSIMSYYVRGVGITLILAITLHWFMNKKWKLSIAYLLSNFLLYLPYFIRNKVYGIKGRYAREILQNHPFRPEAGSISTVSELWNKISTNLNDTIIYGFPQVLFPSIDVSNPTLILMLFGIAIIGLSFLGVWFVKQYRYFLGSFLILNIGILLLWRTGNGVRYVWPLVGFIMFTSFYGLYAVILKLLKRRQSLTIKYFFGSIFLLLAFFHTPGIRELESQAQSKLHPAYKNYFKIAKTIKKQGKDCLVVCRKASLFSYYSASRTAGYRFTLDDKELIQHLVDINADYVVLEQLGYSSTYRYLLPAIQKNQNLFNVVMHLKNPDTYLLQFHKEKAKINN